MDNKPGLTELLKKNKHNPLIACLLQDYPKSLVFTESRPIALREVKDIYRFRAGRNANMGEPIKGFKELIEGLDTFTDDAVVIYSIESAAGPYKIFANAARTMFAGVLKFPKEPRLATSEILSELQAV